MRSEFLFTKPKSPKFDNFFAFLPSPVQPEWSVPMLRRKRKRKKQRLGSRKGRTEIKRT